MDDLVAPSIETSFAFHWYDSFVPFGHVPAVAMIVLPTRLLPDRLGVGPVMEPRSTGAVASEVRSADV
ncbi:hypothetical protein DEO23_12085 [Brachybacterium endophyticum]|uniref:Uncharacterized protein n=2 Tax=Brachybacterium endophyticum TaxID=2182385 RepID=A0A2U2RHI0_9MICO|nr:hypothetical protein DEO23_12085 [Brachybacterium endophyticum]